MEHAIFAVREGIKRRTVGKRTETVQGTTVTDTESSKENVTIAEGSGIRKLTVGRSIPLKNLKNLKNPKKLMK